MSLMEDYTSSEIHRIGWGLNMVLSDFYIPCSPWLEGFNVEEFLGRKKLFLETSDITKIILNTFPYKLN